MSSNSASMANALTFQDLEKVEFSQDLRKNTGDYADFVNSRVNQMSDEAFNRKRTAFQKAQIDLARYMDMEHNANSYKIRNADVERLQRTIKDQNDTLLTKLTNDKDNSKRQFEINEYFYYNKLETLFFLQLFFISALVMAIIVHFQKVGTLDGRLAGILTTILLAIVIITGVTRYFYTSRTRDKRLWHRRRFEPPSDLPVEGPLKCEGNNLVLDVDKVLPKGLTQCGGRIIGGAESKFDSIQNSIINDVMNYQTTGETSTMFGNVPGSICPAA